MELNPRRSKPPIPANYFKRIGEELVLLSHRYSGYPVKVYLQRRTYVYIDNLDNVATSVGRKYNNCIIFGNMHSGQKGLAKCGHYA